MRNARLAAPSALATGTFALTLFVARSEIANDDAEGALMMRAGGSSTGAACAPANVVAVLANRIQRAEWCVMLALLITCDPPRMSDSTRAAPQCRPAAAHRRCAG